MVPYGFEKSLRKTLQYELGSCPGTSSQCPLPAGSTRGPGAMGSDSAGLGQRGPGDKHSGGLWGTKVPGTGGHACVPLHPQRCCLVATATLSGLHCSIPQHRAWIRRQGHTKAPCPSPYSPWTPAKHPGCPHIPSPRHQQPHTCLCLSPRRRGMPSAALSPPATRTGWF